VVAFTTAQVLQPLGPAAARYAEVRAGLHRVADLVAAGASGDPAPAGSALPRSAAPRLAPVERPDVAGLPVRVSLRCATVAYPPRGRPALRDVDLELAPGERVALIGPSGAGKSTLLAVIAGQVPLRRGRLAITGAPATVPRWALTGGVFADAHLFSTTVRDNIVLGRPWVTGSMTIAALRAAGLAGWVDQLDTVVGTGGRPLSGGERQRLLLARALLDAPPVLLLDEPTEGLDPAAADEVLTTALAAAGGATVLVVTHRAADLAKFDRVMALDTGRLRQIRGIPEPIG
jgi:ATP-binding cassette subfamily C protein CydC